MAKTEQGNLLLSVSEQIANLIPTSRELEKKEVESHQMGRLQIALGGSNPDLTFEVIKQGDRPDFLVKRGDKTFGVDMAALAWSDRRQSSAKFRQVREYLRAYYIGGRLRQCKNLSIDIKFNSKKFPSLETLEFSSAIEEMVSKFEAYSIDPQLMQVDPSVSGKWEMPQPIGETGSTSCGLIQWYVSGTTPPLTSFGLHCGFEVRHDIAFTVTGDDIAERINEIVAKHDRTPEQNIDELVIVAGGPDQWGDGMFEEVAIANAFAGEMAIPIAAPSNISRVLLLNWHDLKVSRLYQKETTT